MAPQSPPIVHALQFRWLTPAYDLVVAATTRERTVEVALWAQARIESGHRVLDLTSGTGTLAILAKHRQQGAEIVGIDADPAIISIARSADRRGTRAGLDALRMEALHPAGRRSSPVAACAPAMH